MRLLGNDEGNERQAHADEYDLAVMDLAGGGGDHQRVKGEGPAQLLILIADLRTSAMVESGSFAPCLGAIQFFSPLMMSFSSLWSSGVGSQFAYSRSLYSFSSIFAPFSGLKSCPTHLPILRLNLMSGQ